MSPTPQAHLTRRSGSTPWKNGLSTTHAGDLRSSRAARSVTLRARFSFLSHVTVLTVAPLRKRPAA